MLACAAFKAVASSFMDFFDSHGGDGKTPATHEVETDHNHAGLSAQWRACFQGAPPETA